MSFWSTVQAQYEGLLSLYVGMGALAALLAGKWLLLQSPAMRRTRQLNLDAAEKQLTRSFYMPIQNRSMLWGLISQATIFLLILPFILTPDSQPWWKILLDIFIILMVYDFFYYLVHRFLFHDGPLGGPLLWVHAVHHQQRNPCRKDSNYLHPLETCIGIGLYGATIGGLGLLMGGFHVVTIIVTLVAFSEINQHNHDLMEENRFPFKYLHYMSFMHHVHHAKFTAGNYATISLLYDWLFGTYDTGRGYQKSVGQVSEKKAES